MRGSAYSSDQLRETFRGGNVNSFVKAPDRNSPIQHVIYVIKENRTYDQVLGDMPKGNGDKSLTIFGEDVTRICINWPPNMCCTTTSTKMPT